MNKHFALVIYILLLAAPLWAREKTDVIVMTNGDHITCEIKALNEEVLYVSLDYVVQTISLQWSKVAQIKSDQLFIVKAEDGSVYTGTLRTAETAAGRPVEIRVFEAPQQENLVEQSRVVQMGETSDKFWQRFNGEISSGINYAKGNEAVQYTFGSQVEYLRERWSAQANFDSTLNSSSGTNTSNRNQLVLGGQHLLPANNWFYSGIGSFLQSSEQQIQLQTTVGAGVGRYLTNSSHASIALVGGFAWQNTDYDESIAPIATRDIAAALIAADVKLFRFNKTNLTVTALLLPAVSEPGRIQFDLNATYYIKIFSNLTWNISYYGNWDNQPPSHFSGSDYGTSSGLSWTFGIR